MTAQIRCQCGKQLRVSEHHLGRRVQCPACGWSQVLTNADLSASAMAAGIVTSVPSVPTRMPDITASLPVARPTLARLSRRGRRALLVLALLVAVVGGVTTWWLLRPHWSTPEDEFDDLALIPGDAQGVGTIRLADLWKTPAMQKTLAERDDHDTRIVEEMGLRPDQIERLSGVSVDIEKHTGWIIMRTLTPYDMRAVLARLGNRREVPYDYRHYHVGTTPDGATRALYFAGTRVIVVGTETGVKRCLEFAKRPAGPGPLDPIIAQAAEGKHTAVAGIIPPMGQLLELPKAPNIHQVRVSLDVGKEAALEAVVQMGSEKEAARFCQVLTGFQKLPNFARLISLNALLGRRPLSLVESLNNLLDQVTFTQEGSAIQITAHIDDGSMAAKELLALPAALGR